MAAHPAERDRRPVGIVLAGGQARRMGGGDKGLLPFGSGTILDEIVRRLTPQCATLLLSANGDPLRFAGLLLPVIPDHAADRGAGPLAGVLAGLDAVAAQGGTDALVVPGDTPLLPPDLACRLADARRRTGSPVAVARSAGREHPAVALWAVASRDTVRTALREEGERRLGRVQRLLGRALADWAVVDGQDPFHNVNTPADLAALQGHRSAQADDAVRERP